MSRVDVLARRFRVASNRYIVCESASIKVCLYEVMVSSDLFEKSNEQHIFFKAFYNEVHFKFPAYNVQCKFLQWEISPYRKYVIAKQKMKILWFMHMQ